jgi:RNA polymerase sigma factor (sigma-70 family)
MTNYTKEDYLTVNFMIEQLLVTHFSEWVKPQDRNEVRQEILDKMLTKKIQHSDAKGNLGKWLYRLIKNHLTDSFRKNRRNIIQPMEDLSYLSIPVDDSELLREELFIDRWTQYNDLLARENPMDEKIVRLRHEKGLKYKQIASELSMPEGPLAMRYKRIKARLKENYRHNRLLE